MRSVRAHSGDIPESFKDFMDFDTYRKGISYTLDKTKFGIFESFCGLIFLSLVLALWILPKMFDLGMDAFGVSVFGQAVTLIAMAVVLSLPDLPFELYSQFVIEQEYGFNNSTIKLWIADKFKSLLVGLRSWRANSYAITVVFGIFQTDMVDMGVYSGGYFPNFG
ncbi:MAG: M48 family metallopeptidase [Bacilli bacterium]